ncbi:MAG TPA: VWA domain-containing protein [Bdellovibrionota bacterium]|nr:VWA domain-containing protein [Bdellovibrionota bacterium]
MKSKAAVFLSILVSAFAVNSCAPVSTANLTTPDSTITSVSMQLLQIDTASRPDVRVFLSIEDQSDNFLTDFRLGNFSILEDGTPGVPYEVGPVTDPLSVVIILDRSGSMSASAGSVTREEASESAAVSMLNAMDTDDAVALIEFDDEVTTTYGFTTDKATVAQTIVANTLGGATAVYDAVYTAAELASGRAGRKLLLILTDGDDNSSSHTLEEAISRVNLQGVAVYTVGLGTDLNTDALRAIAAQTGAEFFQSADGTDLSAYFVQVLERMNNLYYVKYRQRKSGMVRTYLNFGSLTAVAQKSFPDPRESEEEETSP